MAGHPNGRKPPNPQGVPKSWGKKPSAPKPHSHRGNSGCAVTALAMLGSVLAVVAGLGYGIAQVVL